MADLGRQKNMWIEYARKDLLAAKLLLENGGELIAQSAYHSQQCAEKIIKAYLTVKRIRFNKTHRIIELIKLIEPIDSELAKLLTPTDVLTKFAISYRYPDAETDEHPLTEQNTQNAFQIANWVSKRF